MPRRGKKGIRQVLEPLNEIYGTIEFNVFDPNGDNEQQISILTDLCTQNYDALIIQCVDGTGIVPRSRSVRRQASR